MRQAGHPLLYAGDQPDVEHRWGGVADGEEGLDQAVSDRNRSRGAVGRRSGVDLAEETGTAEYRDDIAYEAGRCDVEADETLPTHLVYGLWSLRGAGGGSVGVDL